MNLTDYNQRIPAGLLNDGTGEFYINNNEMHLSYRTHQFTFDDFPDHINDLVDADMAQNPIAVACLINDFNLYGLKEQRRQYLACRHGGFDLQPDISADGTLNPSEYVDCGKRGGACKSEGKLCTSILLPYGKLSEREIMVLSDIGSGFLDKEIASKREMSEHSVRHLKDSIARKSGLQNERKTVLVGLAYKLGLVTF